VRQKTEQVEAGWLGEARIIGITAGASTPNNKVGETISKVCETAGVESDLKQAIA
jgi:4-hydroxy-3-methylbut-2-enyl diphosphate reductase IspH